MNGAAVTVASAEPPLPPPRLDTRDFRVDGWLVQPTRNLIVQGGTEIRLRPQLIDVLACLATRPGRVVSKDQLLAEVWNDRFVAASGVARCVAELRQVLADDARQPRIIETISKRGYRLIAPVEWTSVHPPGTPPTASPIDAGPVAPARSARQNVVQPVGDTLSTSMKHRSGLILAARALLATAATLGVFLRDHVRLVLR